ncbi:universal stress protein [Chroococcidiopsis sp. FACHB-1243]|uniref:universal stress protein n=1 Tax=Chroococcidiopsis sp. [FACHB-1243] TaxID=2692781 RepID=UPI0017860771|nr:universal stress protein [Chroococcidiopsis sp. [FACHB-1243]]MBD2304498.1 universal stress protein [Chroococcidiopsis sp. [FACHB-1243]]
MFKTVLFPIDRSRETQEAVGVVVEIVQKYGSRLILLSVVEASEDAGEGMESPDVVARLLEDAQSVFKQQGIQTEAIERQGKPAFAICDVADEVSANLIVMGCRGLGLTEEGVTESVTNRVINLSPCPVLVVP